MTEIQKSDPDSPVHPKLEPRESSPPELEEYAGGLIQARIGFIPLWLLVVYAVAFRLGAVLHVCLLGRSWTRTAGLGCRGSQ